MTARLLVAGIVLLLTAWAMSTRPFKAPDEPSHYLRALTLAHGRLLGPKAPYLGPLSPLARAFVATQSRSVTVPTRLAPPYVPCSGVSEHGSCTEVTPTGNYLPAPYVLPAAVLTMAPSASTALWVSRLVSAFSCAMLLLLAVRVLWSRAPWSLLGPFLALTPMVFFVCSILNSSSLEVAASLCFAATVRRISRPGTRVAPSLWGAFALSGTLTILSFQAGPYFALIDIAVGAALAGPKRLRALCDGPAAPAAAAVLVVAVASWLLYSAVSGASHTPVGVESLGATLRDGIPGLGRALRDAVGTFGAMTIPLPGPVVVAWGLLVGAALALGLVVGSPRERWVLAAVAVLTVTAPVLLEAWVSRRTGFGLQGREVLPLLVVLPALVGEVLARHAPVDPRWRWLPAAALGLVLALQAYAWSYNARTNAAPSAALAGPWSPPLGWAPWAALAAVGVAALLVVVWLSQRDLRAEMKVATA